MAQSFFPSSSPGTRIFPLPCPAASPSWSPPPPSSHGRRRRGFAAASSLHLAPEDVAELVRNKVLIAATAASAIGQLAKPFTSGKDGGGVDLRAAVRSGGMPSTHSAAVVAVATSLGLERGFADSIFGMSVVFAAIVMFDAQGVRREVGNHARVLNKLLALREKITQMQRTIAWKAPPPNSTPQSPRQLRGSVPVPEKVGSSQSSVASPYPRHSSGTKSSR